MDELEYAKIILADWCTHLAFPIERIQSIQLGNFEESGISSDPDHLGATFQSPNGKQWMIAITDSTPVAKLEEVILHELLHVMFAADGENGEETLVNLAVQALVKIRANEPLQG